MTTPASPVIEETLQLAIDRFWETIPPIWGHIRRNLAEIAAENFEISVEQFHILRHIRKGLGSVSELAEVKQISRPAISQAVDILVDKGLVSRQQDPNDRRYVHLVLTPAGNELLNALFKKNRAWMAEKMAGLSDEQLIAITAALNTLKSAFDEPPTPPLTGSRL
jgi:DNA-binding MarR family transcriptional regulator